MARTADVKKKDGPRRGEERTHEAGLSTKASALSGAVAGGASRVLTAPFDVVKIRFQLQVGPIATPAQRRALAYGSVWSSLRKVAQEEGLLGLWRGNLAATYLWIGYGAVQFPVYEAIKQELHHTSLEPFHAFVAGGGAGLVATVSTYPFDVIRTQFAAQGLPRVHDTMWSFVRATVKAQGVHGLFAGLTPAALQIIPRMGLSFTVFEKLDERQAMAGLMGSVKSDGDPETWIGTRIRMADEAFRWCLNAVYGGLAGATARVAVHPFDTVKRRMQAQVFVTAKQNVYGHTPRFESFWGCFAHVVRHEGVAALYKGLVPTLLKSVFSTAIIFSFYEGLKGKL